MTALLWFVRILIFLLILRFVLRLIFGTAFARRAAAPRRVPERSGGELVRDPVCGTYIPKAGAFVIGKGDAAKYFCSIECRDKYQGT